MIVADNIYKSYTYGKQKIEVLHGINLKINKGEFVTLTGPSGSGKSTLLNLLAGIDVPDSGSIIIEGKELSKMNSDERTKWRKENIGYIPQFFYLVPFLTVIENVEIMAKLAKINNSKEASLEALEKVGLKDKAKRYPSELSGGEIQRVAIARAIVHNPNIIIADEPTAFLDIQNKQNIVEILLKIWDEGKTVILATHDAFLAKKRIVELVDGKIVSEKYA
jgi:ABC-type lipoprotein export system ATPase subunit